MKNPVSKTKVRGKVLWRVNLKKSLTGSDTYQRRFFKSKAAALNFYSRFACELKHYGDAFARLTIPERAALGKFYDMLRLKSLTLEDAVAIIDKAYAVAVAPKMTVTEALQSFHKECKDAALDDGTIREYKSQLGRFERTFGQQAVKDLTKIAIRKWLDEIGVKGTTLKNYITSLRTFFNFCIREEVIVQNPAQLLRKPVIRAKSPTIFTIEEVQLFINYVLQHEPQMLAALGLQLFAGIRMCEVVLLEWRDVDFQRRTIHVRLEVSKKPHQRERWIKMTDTLFVWLSAVRKPGGLIFEYPSSNNYQRRRSKAFKAATGKPWPRNAARHSFGLYKWSFERDIKQTAGELGNSPYVARRYYITEVAQEQGEQFLRMVAVGDFKKQTG